MELLPIIYNILIIISALTLIVIAVSYISFKRNSKPNKSINRDNNRPVKVKTINQKTNLPQISPQITKTNNRQSKEAFTQNIRSKKQKGSINKRMKLLNPTSTNIFFEKNISISHRNSERLHDTSNFDLKKSCKRTGPKNLFNNVILENYADETNDEMFTLNIKIEKVENNIRNR